MQTSTAGTNAETDTNAHAGEQEAEFQIAGTAISCLCVPTTKESQHHIGKHDASRALDLARRKRLRLRVGMRLRPLISAYSLLAYTPPSSLPSDARSDNLLADLGCSSLTSSQTTNLWSRCTQSWAGICPGRRRVHRKRHDREDHEVNSCRLRGDLPLQLIASTATPCIQAEPATTPLLERRKATQAERGLRAECVGRVACTHDCAPVVLVCPISGLVRSV